MQTRRERLDYGMTLLPSLEKLVPEDHPICRLDRVLDLSFVHETVRDKYCQDNGRPSVDPEVVIRLFLMQQSRAEPQPVLSLSKDGSAEGFCRAIWYEGRTDVPLTMDEFSA